MGNNQVTDIRDREHQAVPKELDALRAERDRIDRELANLVDFIAKGKLSSPRLAEEVRAREQRLAALDQELERAEQVTRVAPLQVHRTWVEEKLRGLRDLLARDPQGARREVQKHIEDLRIAPAPEAGPRVLRVTGRGKSDGLLGEEAVRLQLVAGAGFEPATFGL